MKKLKKIHAMLYAMEQNPAIIKTVLMKYIFFIDLIHYNQQGCLLFDSTYIRMPNGPVESEALTFASETNRHFHVEKTKQRYGSRSKTYKPSTFRAKTPCDLSLFSPYEKTLMAMVLGALRGHQARKVSNLTHELRLWKEFSDGDTIPLEYFELNDKEIALLKKNGLYVDGFQRTFCRTMKEVAEEIASSISPLNPARVAAVEEVLDDLIRKFPLPDLEVFYDSYLSWDDTFRSAIRNDPSHVPALTEACCDAVCYVSFAVNASKGECAELLAYCEKIEAEFNAVNEALTRGNSAEPTTTTSNLLDQTMHLSRTLALEMPRGRR